MVTRRQVLTLGGMVGSALLVPKIGAAGTQRTTVAGHHHAPRAVRRAAAATGPFTTRMPVPRVLAPAARLPGVDVYRLAMRPATVEILPGYRTDVLSFGGQFVGPTIRARSGRRVLVRYANDLAEAANVHLHGGHVPAGSDGHPTELIEPGQARSYHYPNRQRGATLWYHDHTHHLEAEHVYRGLRGFYLIEDADERRLGLPAGRYDVPIMLSDALLDDTGTLVFDPWDPFTRPTLLANGRSQPYFPVAARKYRFRLLNAAPHRMFQLSLDGAELIQIGSDGGLLPAPVRRTELLLSPAERVEVVVDFSRYPAGSRLVLSDATGGPVLRFDVTGPAADPSRVPATLRPLPPAPPATVERELTLNVDPEHAQTVINGQTFDPARVDAQVTRGSTEIWRIRNADGEFGVDHNFHLHLVQFRVLDRDGNPPLPGESGLKDTVLVRPGETVRVQATFTDYLGRYVYHCHLLEHATLGMMGQLEVVP